MPQPRERLSANCSVSLDLSSLIPKQKTACSHGTVQQPAGSSPAPALSGVWQVCSRPFFQKSGAKVPACVLSHSVLCNPV